MGIREEVSRGFRGRGVLVGWFRLPEAAQLGGGLRTPAEVQILPPPLVYPRLRDPSSSSRGATSPSCMPPTLGQQCPQVSGGNREPPEVFVEAFALLL